MTASTRPSPTPPAPRPAGSAVRPAADRALHAVPGQPHPSHPAGPPELRLLPAPSSLPPYDDGEGTPARLHLVRSPVVPDLRHRPDEVHHPPVSDGLPDARPFARALVQRLLEVRGGVRPVQQLQRDTTPALYADLEGGLAARPRPTGPRPSGRDIRSVHVQQRPDGVAEVCATVRRGERMAALALRLEAHRGQWLCTRVQGL